MSNNAMIRGRTISGTTLTAIICMDSMNVNCASEPIIEKSRGARKATARLDMMENVARRGTLPPSIPVITGAAVAVGRRRR